MKPIKSEKELYWIPPFETPKKKVLQKYFPRDGWSKVMIFNNEERMIFINGEKVN